LDADLRCSRQIGIAALHTHSGTECRIESPLIRVQQRFGEAATTAAMWFTTLLTVRRRTTLRKLSASPLLATVLHRAGTLGFPATDPE
jgi:hypothetical protein